MWCVYDVYGGAPQPPKTTISASDMVRMCLHYINTHLGCYQGCVSGVLCPPEVGKQVAVLHPTLWYEMSQRTQHLVADW